MKSVFRRSPIIFAIIGLCFFEIANAESRLRVGDAVPPFAVKDQRGREFKLSDFKGSLVLLNFWATWCPPCVEELPSMDALNSSFKAKPFNLLAVSVDEGGWKAIDTFFNQLTRRPSFLVLLDSNKSIAESFGVSKYPETFLISGEGKLLKHYIGAVEWLHPQVLGEIEAQINSSVLRLEKKSTKAE